MLIYEVLWYRYAVVKCNTNVFIHCLYAKIALKQREKHDFESKKRLSLTFSRTLSRTVERIFLEKEFEKLIQCC